MNLSEYALNPALYDELLTASGRARPGLAPLSNFYGARVLTPLP